MNSLASGPASPPIPRFRLGFSRSEGAFLAVALLALLSCALLWWANEMWRHAYGEHMPAAHGLSDARGAATRAYLLSGKFLAGDPAASPDEVASLLDEALLAVDDQLNGHPRLAGVAVRPLAPGMLRARYGAYRAGLAGFATVTRELMMPGLNPGVSETLRIRQRNSFYEAEGLAEAIDTEQVGRVVAELAAQRAWLRGGVVAWLGVIGVMLWLLYRVGLAEAAGRQHLETEQHALRVSEARFAALFQGSPLACCLVSGDDGQVVDANRAWLSLLETPREQGAGSVLPDWLLQCLPPEGGDGPCHHQLPSGREVDLVFRRESLQREGESGWLVLCLDVTEQKRAESLVLHVNQELEQRVAIRTRELEAANRELDSFAYAVSHDLRAPLRALVGFSDALREDCGPTLSGESAIYLAQIEQAGRRMGALIDGILALSRSSRGELRRSRVDVSAMAEEILLALAAGEPHRRVSWQVTPAIVVSGDRDMLQSVMHNLLDNAWKYTAHTGSPLITVGVRPGEDAGGRWVEVRDNGAGFDMKFANKLYQPFQRLHRQDEFPGLGIGLATVQRIIHRHGGSLVAEGRVGQGAAFAFTLPEGLEALGASVGVAALPPPPGLMG